MGHRVDGIRRDTLSGSKPLAVTEGATMQERRKEERLPCQLTAELQSLDGQRSVCGLVYQLSSEYPGISGIELCVATPEGRIERQ